MVPASWVPFLPPTPVYLDWYYEPMEEWLRSLPWTLGRWGALKPYDPGAAKRLADYAAGRGYDVPDDPAKQREIFGYGWWKYAPEVAAQLLERNGFSRDKDGGWLLPDGTPWKITITSHPNPAHPAYKNSFAIAQQWRRFGIEVEVVTTEQYNTLATYGQFDVSSVWPAYEPWGGHPDMYRTLRMWDSDLHRPVGEVTYGHQGRWSHPDLDVIIDKLEKIGFDDPELIPLAIEGLKITTAEMPSIATFGYPGFVGWMRHTDQLSRCGESLPAAVPALAQLQVHAAFLEPTGNK